MQHDQKLALTFELEDNESPARRITISDSVIKIGRSPSSPIAIDDPSVARMQAVIEVQGPQAITLIDLDGSTQVDGQDAPRAELHEGSVIRMGRTNLRLVKVAPAMAERVAQAQPLDAALPADNPFAKPSLSSIFGLRPETVTPDEDKPEGSYEYRLLGSAPAVPADEIDTTSDAIAVQISWGRNVVHLCHLDGNGSFAIGEEADFAVPADKLGSASAPLVAGGRAVLLAGAQGSVTLEGDRAQSFAEAIAAGLATPSATVPGAHELALRNGMVVRQELSDLSFEVRGEKRAKRSVAALSAAALTSGALAYVVGSFVGHAGLLAAMAAFMPPLGTTSDDELSDEQRYYINQLMDADAQQEMNEPEEEALVADDEPGNDGGQGTRSVGEEGKMGSDVAPAANARYGIEGPADNVDPRIARARALQDAESFGIISLLGGDQDAPIAAWGDTYSSGSDPLSAEGNMWGDQIGASHGASGLGLSGIGEGGGGRGEGIGLGYMGYIGHGSGTGDGQGFGPGGGHSFGHVGRRHKPGSPRLRAGGETSVAGRLPPEVIQRIIRSNYGRFRGCYESALRTNPNLQGRVAVSFMIGRNGTVQAVSGGGDLPDGGVISCVSQAFYGLSFPAPEGGVVRVTYPILFSPTT
ncbi:MAG: AgmX/PglI C-terminal domain-containing protein [Polyangiaceae bacterium]